MKICENGVTRDRTPTEIAALQRSIAGLSSTATDAELAAAQSINQKKQSIEELKVSAAAFLAAYQYQGVNFPLSRELIAYYKGIADTGPKIPAGFFPFEMIGENGTIEAKNAQSVADLYADMQSTYMATMKGLGAAIKEIKS